MKNSKPFLKSVCVVLSCLIILSTRPAIAHNAVVHEGMTSRAYSIMIIVNRRVISQTIEDPPPGVRRDQWIAFHVDLDAALAKLAMLAKDPNPFGSRPTVTESALAKAASDPDYHTDDVHLFYKVSNAAGQSLTNKLTDETIKHSAAALLIPIVCGISCLGKLLGGSGDDCKKCIKQAKKFADHIPTPADLKNLIPGFGDVSSNDYTGLWHFINMSRSPQISNTYDDHQGMLYEAAGPFGVPGVIDIGIMAITDTVGLSVNPEKSDGVKRYQIRGANDSFPDGDKYTSTRLRTSSEWQKYAMGHVVFEPLDNFGLWGWREFQLEGHNLGHLGYALHAIGDATVPMHVTGTTSWGHRPYENAQERLWGKEIRAILNDEAILAKAFVYRQEILAWRAQGHPDDIPIRHLIRSVAKKTYDYSLQKQIETGDSWPFDDDASLKFFTGDGASEDVKEAAVDTYAKRPDAAALVKPLLEDGIAAKLALLMSATELPGITQQKTASPAGNLSFSLARWSAAESPTLATSPLDSQFASVRREQFQAQETPAQTQFFDAVRTEYARLGRMLIMDSISPAEYLQRVWSVSDKARVAGKSTTWAERYAKGDKDGDLVPDSLDRCLDTLASVTTDDCGCPKQERLPKAPSRQDMQSFFRRFNILVSPKCQTAPTPQIPQLLKIGTLSPGRDLTFIVKPISNQPANCLTFYQFAIRFKGVFEGNKHILPLNAYREVVFRNTDSKDSSLSAENRLVFRLSQIPPQSEARQFMMLAWGRYDDYDWRVRAVNANGLASEWSDWQRVEDISLD